MTQFQQELRVAATFLRAFMDFVLAWAAYGWWWLGRALDDSGLPPLARTALMVAILVLLASLLLRALRGLLRLLLAAAAGLLAARALGWF